jgi:hypothetical protein
MTFWKKTKKTTLGKAEPKVERTLVEIDKDYGNTCALLGDVVLRMKENVEAFESAQANLQEKADGFHEKLTELKTESRSIREKQALERIKESAQAVNSPDANKTPLNAQSAETTQTVQ